MYYLPNTSTVSETKQETRASLLNKMAELLMPKFSAQSNGRNSKNLNLMTHIKHKNTQLGTTWSHKQNQLFGQAMYYLPNTSAVSETTWPVLPAYSKFQNSDSANAKAFHTI